MSKRQGETMAQQSLLLDIQVSYNQFTKTEKKIAEFVIKNTNQVLFMSITDLADACKVADASVHRFCRTMGLKGYQEFKMKLSLSMSPDEGSAKETKDSLLKLDSLGFTLDQILQGHISALKETRLLIQEEEVEKTLRMMEEAKTIYFFGVGDSLLSAKEARNKFLRITNKVSCVDDPHMQAMTASMADEKDLIVIISYSGSTKDNVHVAKIAKKSGAKVVGITRFLKSPLTSYTDTLLVCGSNEGPLDGGSMGAKLSQLYIIDVLFQEYYRRNKEASKENNRKTSKAVVEKLY
ncbi:MAG: MurR/RpiR family transcriptional regulator [Lachnospiraceae bacterium]|nr:MurR/RpiR family transcriptional regulator [Lachnospiraceae bacterium]MCI7596932.1 MurR/RpiR family transcriptional regulator [Lachnospiraceae bacterium]